MPAAPAIDHAYLVKLAEELSETAELPLAISALRANLLLAQDKTERDDIKRCIKDAKQRIRPLTPAEAAFCSQYAEFIHQTPPPPHSPTMVEPGPDKVDVLARRLESGYSLWHADDAKLNSTDQLAAAPIFACNNRAVQRADILPSPEAPVPRRERERLSRKAAEERPRIGRAENDAHSQAR